jgi:hypothetical protein
MKIAIGIVCILMALGLVGTVIVSFVGFCSFLRKGAIRKAFLYLLLVILPVGLGYLLVTSGVRLIQVSSQAGDMREFIASINAANQATRVINKGPGIMSSADADQMTKHYREALGHAEKVNAEFLERKYEGWGQHFDRGYRPGLCLIIRGNETADACESLSGQQLMDAWDTWFNANVDSIRKLK